MQQHGKKIESVDYLIRNLEYSHNMASPYYKMTNGNYRLEKNGNIVALYHYGLMILIWDTRDKEILAFYGTTKSDTDAINTAIYRATLCTYEYTGYYDCYISLQKDGKLKFIGKN